MHRRASCRSLAVLVAGVTALGLFAGCGSSETGGGDAGATTAEDDRIGPTGDAELVPLLLTLDELDLELVEGDGRREQPQRAPLCPRDELPPTWEAQASMLWLDPEPNVIGGVGQSILSFAPSGAEAWFATLLGCVNLTNEDTRRYTELSGIGDQALVSVPAEYRQSVKVPNTTFVVRVGDRVVLLSGAVERDVLTDAVAKRAVAKAAGR